MCDTIVVLGNSSEDGSVIFGKNSDRDPNEVQAICYIPRATHEDGAEIQCQYISIPQVKETLALILSKPAWLKVGCEMGANECGVVMGNETVFTREPYERIALLGMDLMRIALERARTARQGLTIITNLIETYGQGGVASQKDPNYLYHNSFLIADPQDAWVLETANKFWVAQQVHDVASISNGFTIQDKWDLASPGLVEHAIEQGWCESKSEFNFTNCYSDLSIRPVLGCIPRQSRTINRLLDKKGQINVSFMMDILRDHGAAFEQSPFNPAKGTMSSVCMHANSQTFSQTVGSYVANLTKDFQVHWLTGTSAPCLSVFKPFFFENPDALAALKTPLLTNDGASLWWKHEKLHRIALLDYPNRAPLIIAQNKEIEHHSINAVNALKKNISLINETDLKAKIHEISSTALSNNLSLIEKLPKSLSKLEITKSPPRSYVKFWTTLSEKDGLSLT
ncbi:MAG TPA: C69 family dipeptidase [Candidatus Deferrimicrobium sp.]|nr:C69 family dipeptidase [Candidatus Deferrimicrobium sp.]